METVEKESYRELFRVIRRSISFAWKYEKGLFLFQIVLAILSAVVVYFQLISFSTIINEIIRIKSVGIGITHQLVKSSIFLGITLFVPSLLWKRSIGPRPCVL